MRRRIKTFGTEHANMMAAAKDLGMNYKTMWNRLSRSEEQKIFDVELLVSISNLLGIEIQFIGLDGQARYKVPWSKELQTTREIIQHERPDLLERYNQANPTGRWNPYS